MFVSFFDVKSLEVDDLIGESTAGIHGANSWFVLLDNSVTHRNAKIVFTEAYAAINVG